MVRGINFNHNLGVALLLGVAVLITNNLSYVFSSSSFYVPVGNLFLFMSAGALGLGGAMISFAVGIVPDTLVTGRHIDFLRLLTLCAVLGYSARRWPRLPGFLIALAAWIFVFGPVLFWLSASSIDQPELRRHYIFLTGLTEALLVLVSGTLLLSSKVWATICTVPRHLPASSILIHLISSISTIALFGALSIWMGPFTSLPKGAVSYDLPSLTLILLFGMAAPAFLAWRLSIVMTKNFQELFSSGFLGGGTANKSFSGLSSEFWRRQSSSQNPERVGPDTGTTMTGLDTQSDGSAKLIAPDQGLCALNRNGTITFVNRRFKKYCGIMSNDVIGKDLANIDMIPALRKKILQLLEETFTKGPRLAEVKINKLPEKLRFYEVRTHRSDAFEGSSLINGPDSAIITVKDITDRRTVETHLLQSQKLESLGTLVEGIAHSFNNALTTITGLASFARKSQDSSQVERSLNDILKTAFSAGLVVRQLLDFASGRPSHMKAERMDNLIEQRIDLLKRLAGDGCELEFEKGDNPVKVICDSNLIMQALTNLIVNAKEAYPNQSGKITITLDLERMDDEMCELNPGTRPGDYARLRIKDSGQGMSSDTLAKAFDPLFTTKSSTGHTGLGLSITFAIVRAHDGFLTAESHPEKGTTVSLYFPISDGESDSAGEAASLPEQSTIVSSLSELMGNQEKILVVEDERNVRELITTMLTTLGYRVTACNDGQQAYEKASNETFDLILVDAIIPKIRGLDLIGKLKECGVNTKWLLMTGYGPTLQNEVSAGQLIHKPFDLDTLGKAIKSSLTSEGIQSQP